MSIPNKNKKVSKKGLTNLNLCGIIVSTTPKGDEQQGSQPEHMKERNIMIKIYAEFKNGDRKTFKGIDEEWAMCNVIEYAEEHDTEVEYYTEV